MCRNPECHFVNDGHKTEAEARAAWNRRARPASEPAAQWTSETPSEEGHYVSCYVRTVKYNTHKCWRNDVGELVLRHPYKVQHILTVAQYHHQNDNQLLWLRIPDPPLPAESDVKKTQNISKARQMAIDISLALLCPPLPASETADCKSMPKQTSSKKCVDCPHIGTEPECKTCTLPPF
jgi:hypothetical protein